MNKAIVVRGRLCDSRHIELEEPVTEVKGPVEVAIRSVGKSQRKKHLDVFEYIAALPPGTRTKQDIDRQIQEERESWGDR
jgi:hypothetical protein